MSRLVITTQTESGNKMAGVAGLEPVTSAVTGQRSNQLSYTPAMGSEKVVQSTLSSQRGNKHFSRRIYLRQEMIQI